MQGDAEGQKRLAGVRGAVDERQRAPIEPALDQIGLRDHQFDGIKRDQPPRQILRPVQGLAGDDRPLGLAVLPPLLVRLPSGLSWVINFKPISEILYCRFGSVLLFLGQNRTWLDRQRS